MNKLNDKIRNKFGVNFLENRFIFNNKKEYDKIKVLKQIRVWAQELRDLISSDSNYKRQIELAQNITCLQNIISDKREPVCYLDIVYNMTELTPRVFLESGVNLVIIKPSAYLFNWDEEVKERFLEGKYSEISDYYKSLGNETNLGLLPMKLFHPHGYKYVREMTGPTELFLVNRNAEEIGLIMKLLSGIRYV